MNPRYLVADPLMDVGAADVAGLLLGEDQSKDDSLYKHNKFSRRQSKKRCPRESDLIVLHVVIEEQKHLLRRTSKLGKA
jgi:hypothetical protein